MRQCSEKLVKMLAFDLMQMRVYLWSRQKFGLNYLEDKPIEFLEQPMPKGSEYDMNELQNRYRTPIALDESAIDLNELKTIDKSDWRGFLVIKPSFIGDV